MAMTYRLSDIPEDLREHFEPATNIHPTVKNVKLCRWLASLLLPPVAYAPRRLLIPFAGVMSEVIAAKMAGWEEVIAIEQAPEYCEIGAKRLDYWLSRIQGKLFDDPG
jgi:DNA modification methylase